MKRILTLLAALFAFSLTMESRAQGERPEWKFEIEPSELVGFEAPSFFRKDYGWLLTFRLTTTSRLAIKPVGYLRFEGLDAEEQIVWTDSKLVRRVDMDVAYKGGLDLFVRKIIKDVPDSVRAVKMRFENGAEGAAEEQEAE